MTSDAKIGLLLGLVFIFLIAFIINGLPRFRKGPSNNELTTNMVSSQNDPPGIGARERDVIDPIESITEDTYNVYTVSADEQDTRFTTSVPNGPSWAEDTGEFETTAYDVSAPTTGNSENKAVTVPKIYVVKEGDSLTVVAQKVYGSEEGSKPTNITRIFEANRKLLKSRDRIYVGQKLIIPPLPASAEAKDEIDSLLSNPMLERAESIGRRWLTVDSETEQRGWYVVKSGDSLWRIASEQLGDGSRYEEIAKLNTEVITNEDRLSIGMRLRIPAQ